MMKQSQRSNGNWVCVIVPLLVIYNLTFCSVFWASLPLSNEGPDMIPPQIVWQSAGRHFEDVGSDRLRADAGAAADTTRKRTFLETPPDQFVEFSTPFLPPPKTTAAESTTTIILVPSHAGSFGKRQAIRETWKTNSTSSTTVLFVVAHSDCKEFNQDMGVNTSSEPSCEIFQHDLLKLEQEKNNDLLEIPMTEKYRRLSEKIMQAYYWAVQTLPNLKWLAKADDDMFVNIQSLEDYLPKYDSQIPTVIGEIVENALVLRGGKWAEYDYPYTVYPLWPRGSAGHVLSRATVDYFIENSKSLHRYQGEDTNIGIWLDEATKAGHLKNVKYVDARDKFISYGSSACLRADLNPAIVGHDLQHSDLVQCKRSVLKQ